MKVLVIWLAIALIGVLLYMVPGLLDKWKEGKEGVQGLLDHWKFVGSEGFNAPSPANAPAYNCNTLNNSCKYMNDSGLAAYANTLTNQEERNAVNTMINITDNTTTCCVADALSNLKTSSGNNLINKTRDQILSEMNKPGILSSVNSGGVNNTNVNMGSNIGSSSVPSGITTDVGSIFGSNPFMTTTATAPMASTTLTTPTAATTPTTAAPSHPVYPTAKKCKPKAPKPSGCPACPKCPTSPTCPSCPSCPSCPITTKDYIRKDSIPCWACKL